MVIDVKVDCLSLSELMEFPLQVNQRLVTVRSTQLIKLRQPTSNNQPRTLHYASLKRGTSLFPGSHVDVRYPHNPLYPVYLRFLKLHKKLINRHITRLCILFFTLTLG